MAKLISGQEITVAGKLQDMYAGIQEVGNDVDAAIFTGSILIGEMMVAGMRHARQND